MPKTLYKTTLDPQKRKLLQIKIPDGMSVQTDSVICELMGKDVQSRYLAITEWMNVVDYVDV